MRTAVKQALASAVVLSSVLMLASAYYWPIQEAYHPLNTGWNGCSQAANVATNVTFVTAYSITRPRGPALLSIIGPGTEFSEGDALQVRDFMETGGTVLLADDFGTGNSLLQALNVSVRLAGTPLSDLAYYSKEPSFPIIADFAVSPLTANVTAVVFNHPSYLEVGNSSSITLLGFSSPFSFIDLNGTGRPPRNATIDSNPVMASVKIEKGSLVVISDASMFTNEMMSLYGNKRLLENALKLGNGSMFLDVVHLRKSPLTDGRIALKNGIDSIRNMMERYPAAQYLPLAVVAIVTMVALSKMRRRAKNETSVR